MSRLQLTNLVACQVHRHFHQFFLCAYRVDTAEHVCYALINHYNRLVDWQLHTQTLTVADAERCIETLQGKKNPPTYHIGLLYISGNPNEFAWPMVRRITEYEYAEILAKSLDRGDLEEMRATIAERTREAAAPRDEVTP